MLLASLDYLYIGLLTIAVSVAGLAIAGLVFEVLNDQD